MDEIDVKIIDLLIENANMTATEISLSVKLSIPAVNKRISKLVKSGVIDRYTIIINPDKIGKPVLAFSFIVLENPSYIDELLKFIASEKDILECYALAGEFDYILKIRAKDLLGLEDMILRIKGVKGIAKTNTIISLFNHKSIPSVLPT